MRRGGSYLERSRCKSTGSNSNNSSVCSILKDPKKGKLKHQRSVRFEEPDTFSSNDASFDIKHMCEIKTSPKSAPAAMPSNISLGLSKPVFSDYSPSQFLINKPNHRSSRSTVVSNVSTTPNTSPIKILSIVKSNKAGEVNLSPKFQPKTLNYEFRNESFYQKLNKFISAKSSVSPVRSVNTSFAQDLPSAKVSKECLTTASRCFESPASPWSPPDPINSPKKSPKPNIPTGKKSSNRNLKPQGQNVLN